MSTECGAWSSSSKEIFHGTPSTLDPNQEGFGIKRIVEVEAFPGGNTGLSATCSSGL
jgi:hypothetical protein